MSKLEYQGHDEFIPYLMNKAVNALNADFQHFLHQKKLTLTHWRILAFLSQKEGYFSLSSLSKLIAVDKATLSRAINALQKSNHIETTYDPKDKRLKLIQITDAGQDLFNSILPYAQHFSNSAFRNISNKDLIFFKELLIKIYNNSVA